MSFPIYFLRHGETVWNREGRVQGHLDSPLTEKGQAQAARMAALLRQTLGPKPACRLVSSPLGRARATASYVAEALELEVHSDWRLAEQNLGSWNGLTRAEIDIRWPGVLHGADEYDWYYRSPDGETFEDLRGRAVAWLREQNESVIAVAHGLIGKALRAAYAGLANDEAIHFSEPQDTVFLLKDGGISRLSSVTNVGA